MSISGSAELTGLPEGEARGGFVYVAMRCDGAIKVGATRNPRGRAGTLQVQMRGKGLSILRMHFEDVRTWPFMAEGKALELMRQRARTLPGGREWFVGIDWPAAVAVARSVAPTPETVKG